MTHDVSELEKSLEERIKVLENKVDEILEQLNRYKGFIGGIIFIASAIAAALALFFQWARFKH